MKAKKILVDSISLLLAVEYFYEGVSKLFSFRAYHAFLSHMPYVQLFSWGLAVLIPLTEIGLATGLVFSKRPVAFLVATVGALVIFVAWICCVYFVAHVLSWPFDPFWLRMVWLHKIIIALAMCWLALGAAWVAAYMNNPSASSPA